MAKLFFLLHFPQPLVNLIFFLFYEYIKHFHIPFFSFHNHQLNIFFPFDLRIKILVPVNIDLYLLHQLKFF